jgi:nickel-type superoxide dismutase maturation protease
VEENFIFHYLFIFMENDLPEANWTERILFFLGRRKGFLVEGNSMLPALKDGDAVLINPKVKFAAGDIVLARHPFKESVKILKRISEITPDGKYILTGDNAAASTDSRSFGEIPAKDVLGKAVCRLK